MVTSAKQWKGRRPKVGTDLELPSGNVALVKPLDPTDFLTSGMIPDPLSSIIHKAINTTKGLPPSALNKISNSREDLAATLEMFDRVLTHVVLEPVIEMPPPCDVVVAGQPCDLYANAEVHQDTHKSGRHRYHEGERIEDVLYADEVDFQDKTFIFQWVLGGTRDLEQFRRQQAASMDAVPDSKDLQQSPV